MSTVAQGSDHGGGPVHRFEGELASDVGEERHAGTRRQDRIAASILLACGVAVVITAFQLGIGSPEVPGAGMWPLLVGTLLTFTSLMIVLRPDGEAVERFDRHSVVVAAGVLAVAVYAWLFERVGYELPTLLMLVLWLRVFGKETWRMTVIVAISAVVVVYLLFIELLAISLPHLIAF